MLAVISTLIIILIIIFDFLPFKKSRQKKDTVIYVLMLAIGYLVLVLYSVDIDVPSPAKPITAAVEKIGSIFKS